MFKKELTRYCVDCEYSRPPLASSLSIESYTKCVAPKLERQVDVVSGKVIPFYASSVRSMSGGCGLTGKWFVLRDKDGDSKV